jgi:hypothetical protein
LRSLKNRRVLERVVPGLASVVDGDIVSTMCLIDGNITLFHSSKSTEAPILQEKQTDLFCHIIPVLRRVDASLQWRGPRRCVDTSAFVLGTLDGLPVDKKCDRIFSLWNTIVGLAGGDTSGCTRYNASRHSSVLKHPAADINVM